MVRLPEVHGVGVQQPPDVQHVVAGQQGLVLVQQGVWQQIGWTSDPGGIGQHGTMCAFCEHAMCGEREDAEAGPTIARAQIAAPAARSESGTMKRRIADTCLPKTMRPQA